LHNHTALVAVLLLVVAVAAAVSIMLASLRSALGRRTAAARLAPQQSGLVSWAHMQAAGADGR
jgi:hypothetical protein